MSTRAALRWIGRTLALGVLLGVLMFVTYVVVGMISF